MGGLVEAKSIKSPWKTFKNIYSSVLLIFSTVLITAAIFTQQTGLSQEIHPGAVFVILWLALIWLSMVEGGQASLVGLPPVDLELYEETHPETHKIMKIIKEGDNLDAYLMGRQFLVLALVFVENLCGDPVEGARVLGLPQWVTAVFLDSGLAIFFMAAMIAKISAQVNASRCMLDYVNNYFATFTLWVSLLIEKSGLLHICYLIQSFFAWASGKPLPSRQETTPGKVWYWIRVLASGALLAFAFAVTIYALFHGETTMWASVPPAASLVTFFFLMAIVGMLEGMQIAFFAIAKMDPEERKGHKWANKTCEVLFRHEGRNLASFMVGRQMMVTMCFFVIARVTTVKVEIGTDENIFGVSNGIQAFFNTGLLGALITTIVASIAWQLIASAFPMAFLNTPVTYVLMQLGLFWDWTGICQGSWVVAFILRRIFRYKRDEVYIGTPEERKAKGHADKKDEHYENNTEVHLYPGVPRLPADFGARTHTVEDIEELEAELMEHKRDVDERLEAIRREKAQLLESLKLEADVEA